MAAFDEMMNELETVIENLDAQSQGLSYELAKATSAIKAVIELHEIISVEEDNEKENICILCEETYPCETVAVILRNFGWLIPE
jgi:hypothetical protein